MLRINLLPSYVSQRRLTRKLVFALAPLLLLSIGVPLFLFYQASQDKAHWLDEAQKAETAKAITDQRKTQAATTRAQIAPLLAKVKYVQDVHQHNTDIVNFWKTVADYSDPKVIYSDAAVSGATLTLKAYSPSIAEIGRYLQAMYNEPDFVSVGIDRLPGYPEAAVSKYYLNNKLIAVDTTPSQSSGGGGGFGGQGSGGFGGQGGGFGGQGGAGGQGATATGRWPYGGTGPVGVPGVPVIGAAAGPGGPGAAPGTAQDPATAQRLAQVLSTDPKYRNIAVNPFAPPQSQYQSILNTVKKIKVRREPQGFPVTITATLKTPLTTPSLPGTAGATTTTGGFPGAPGGYPGGPPPGMGGPGGYPGGPPPGGAAGYPGSRG